MNEIFKLIKSYDSVSIIGMYKNAGKTTTLNHLLKEAKGKVSLGLTSIGRDGEDLDRVTATEKPKIYIEKGTVLATAKQCLFNSDITREIIKTTGINTPMGEIVICKALSDGYVDLGGPSVNSHLKLIREELLKLNAEIVIIDGALNRKSFASPAVTKATILSTGAALSNNMQKVIGETRHTVEILSLPHEEDEKIISLAEEIFKKGRIGVIYKDYSIKVLDTLTALNAAKEITEVLTEDVSRIVIKGAVSGKLIEDIVKSTNLYKNVVFLAEDGTKIFMSEDELYKFKKQGGTIRVLDSINVICVTANPKSPYGYEFPKEKFLEELRNNLSIPVFDVIGGN